MKSSFSFAHKFQVVFQFSIILTLQGTAQAANKSSFVGQHFEFERRRSGTLLLSGLERAFINPIWHPSREVPKFFDAREAWPECPSIGKIIDQGRCASCWALAAAMMMSDRLCIYTKGKDQFEFSGQELMSCCYTCVEASDVNTCLKGGVVYYALRFLMDYGIVSGGDVHSEKGCIPWSESTVKHMKSPECEHYCTNKNYNISYKCDKKFGKDVTELRHPLKIEQVQIEIMINGPVVAVLKPTTHLMSMYITGVYQHPDEEPTDGDDLWHSVRIIGWGEEDGVPYWLVANSWGKNWGQEGFLQILRGKNHLGIERNILAGHFDVQGSAATINLASCFYTIFFYCLVRFIQ